MEIPIKTNIMIIIMALIVVIKNVDKYTAIILIIMTLITVISAITIIITNNNSVSNNKL